ncbi:MAG: hypothetical protein JNK09_14230 [Prolixibacteraceae bacterium]|nr:hypothetical protein [Prolixibacteraceae bacterium]
MLEKGFLRNTDNQKNKHQQIAERASQVLLLLGILVIGGSFVYLLINWGKSDALITMLTPIMASGLGLIFVSYLIRRAFSKLRH